MSVQVSDLGNTDDDEVGPPVPLTDVETVTVTVAAVNDPPELTVTSHTWSVDEGDNGTSTPNFIPLTGVSVADVDVDEPTSVGGFRVTLTVLADLDTANGTLSVTPAGNATVPVNNDRVLTIEGTQADVNATLATLRYTVPTVDFNHLNNQDTANPSGDVFVSVHVSDQTNTSDPDLATELTANRHHDDHRQRGERCSDADGRLADAVAQRGGQHQRLCCTTWPSRA